MRTDLKGNAIKRIMMLQTKIQRINKQPLHCNKEGPLVDEMVQAPYKFYVHHVISSLQLCARDLSNVTVLCIELVESQL